MRYPYQSPVIEQGLSPFVNANMLPGTGTENLPEFLTRKRRACFMKTGQLESVWLHYLKKTEPISSELRKCLLLENNIILL